MNHWVLLRILSYGLVALHSRYEAALMTGNQAAVESLIRGASDTRAQWKPGKLYTPESLSKTKPSA